MEIKGTIKLIGDTQTFESGFTKRQLVVTTEGEYPQEIGIDFVKDKCAVLDNYSTGQNVEVSINIRGNEYNGKYYVNLQAWKIEAGTGIQEQKAPSQNETPFDSADGMDDDLPF